MQRLNSKDFFRGFARAIDIRGAIGGRYVRSRPWHRSDGAAVAADWSAVFGDLDLAFERVKRSHRTENGS